MPEKKEITIRNIDQSGIPDMIGSIFQQIIEALRDILRYQEDLRRQGWEIFTEFKKEYRRAERPKALWGVFTQKELMMRSNRYALSQMQRFFMGFREQENNLITSLIRIAKESPTEFLSAIKSVLTDGNGRMKLPETQAYYDNLLNEISNSIKTIQGNPKNNEKEFRKAKRRNFFETTED